jgi:maltooligosyltrehalose trehalohydrolase
MRPGLRYSPEGSGMGMWAPNARRLELVSGDRRMELERDDQGFFRTTVDGLGPGDRYHLSVDGGPDTPDPASLSQPDGVHGASAVVDLSHEWTTTDWVNPPLEDHVFYELHVGTFSPEGTFAGVAERIPHLVDLGVTAIELMPVAQFPGRRNWGYDGVGLYAVQHSYGGARGLQKLVDDCHRAGLAVFLDVVYNHLGPEGNYLGRFGPYFTDRYRTPWGEAVNLDGRGSDHVRSFLIENALMWIDDFRVDGLRLDAIHALYDRSAQPFLLELAEAVHSLADRQGRRVQLVVENAGNDPRVMRPAEEGGYEMDGAWNDDFHHALHVTLTGETTRYYADFATGAEDLALALSDGYVNAGRFSPYRGRRHGASSKDLARSSLIVFGQNHDQVGNRAEGDRLSTLVDARQLRFAAAATLLAPAVPLLFMGEEWAETRPFLYFVDHGDPDLNDAVRRGRSEEFAGFFPTDGAVPDPADPQSFERSTLDWTATGSTPHARMLELHRTLIRLRFDHASIRDPDPTAHTVAFEPPVITVDSSSEGARVIRLMNASDDAAKTSLPDGRWRLLLDASDERFGGPGTDRSIDPDGNDIPLGPWDFLVYERTTA